MRSYHLYALITNANVSLGLVPSLVLTIFLGVFALYTSKLLIDFKLNHPEVHNMGEPIVTVTKLRLTSWGVNLPRRRWLHPLRSDRS